MQFSSSILLVCALTLFLSAFVTKGMITWARHRNLIDTPNHRSSHDRPTPRGGGVALVGAFYVGLVELRWIDAVQTATLLLLLTALPIAVTGFIDDVRTLSVRIRLLVQLFCAATFLFLLPELPPLVIFGYALPSPLTFALYLLGMVWLTNLYNFMDGIDGIAAGQAVAVGILWTTVLSDASRATSLLLAAAALGFLKYNFPPARIFMGDVGSAFCGFIIGALTLIHAHETALSPLFWLIPLAPFIADATITLTVRLCRQQRIGEPHRSHAYQRLAQKMGGHFPVSVGYFLLTCLPVGLVFLWTASRFGQDAEAVFLVIVAALMVVAAALGAGNDQ